MTFWHDNLNIISSPPPKLITIDGKINNDLSDWLNRIFVNSVNRSAIGHQPITLNSDFHYGATQITTPGQFADKWNIDGSDFNLNVINYNNGKISSTTGSKNYIKITSSKSQSLRIYQKIKNKISLIENQDVSFSFRFMNHKDDTNNIKPHSITFKLGVDMNGNGTIDKYYNGASISLTKDTGTIPNIIDSKIKVPREQESNDPNFLYIIMDIDIDSELELDIFYIKLEIGNKGTFLYNDHTIEKYRIDNTE